MAFYVPGKGTHSTAQGGLSARAARLLRQDLGQVDFGVRRFRLREGPARGKLEDSGRAFLEGFNHAVSLRGAEAVRGALDEVPEDFRGFAFEGAGMGCALLDLLTLSRGSRLRGLLEESGPEYPHLIHVGAGWAFAKLRLRPWKWLPVGDPWLRWLAWDGFGFYQGFFDSDRVVAGCGFESRLDLQQLAMRDQGLGRCLWFHECADPEALRLRVAEFPQWRRRDLWSGIGLAATYAGGASEDELRALVEASAGYRAHLAQGAAFACAARRCARTPLPEHCRTAAPILVGVPAQIAAEWTDTALADLDPRPASAEQYLAWRAGVRRLWAAHTQPDGAGVPGQAAEEPGAAGPAGSPTSRRSTR